MILPPTLITVNTKPFIRFNILETLCCNILMEGREKPLTGLADQCLLLLLFNHLLNTQQDQLQAELKRRPFLTVSIKWFTATKDILGNVLKIGVPVFIMSIFLGAMSLIFNHFLVEYGDSAVADYGISSRLLQFPEFILMGLCEGVVPLIAFSFTADKLRMKHTIGFTFKAIVGLAAVFGVIVYLISDHLIGLFTNDPQLIEMGSYILHVTFLSLFITGMTTLFTGVFQATAQGTAAFVMSIIQGVALIPVLYLANQMNGFHGVVWSLVIADAVAFLVGAIMLYVLRNKLHPELESLA